MNTYGLTPRSYESDNGTVLFKFTLYCNGTDYVFQNLADEATAVKYRLFLKRLKIKLGAAFDPIPHQIRTSQQPLQEHDITALIEGSGIGHILPATGFLLHPKLADSVTTYRWKDGTVRHGFRLRVRGKSCGFHGYQTTEEALAARLHLVMLREKLGDQFNPKDYQRHRSPDAPLLLPLRPKGLGRLTKTFGEFAQEWMQNRQSTITATRWKLERCHLQASVLDYWAYVELRSIDEGQFKRLIDTLLVTRAPATVHDIGKTVAGILVTARNKGVLLQPFNPYPLLYGLS